MQEDITHSKFAFLWSPKLYYSYDHQISNIELWTVQICFSVAKIICSCCYNCTVKLAQTAFTLLMTEILNLNSWIGKAGFCFLHWTGYSWVVYQNWYTLISDLKLIWNIVCACLNKWKHCKTKAITCKLAIGIGNEECMDQGCPDQFKWSHPWR